jgi:predicted flap endonuclease-1-like 5' DNA nuclease
MSIPIGDLGGITPEIEAGLKEQGIYQSEDLLKAAATVAGRDALAASTGAAASAILELANRADLARINGIGRVYSDLLEHAGVDTVPELANRRADNLYARMAELNTELRIARRTPPITLVEDWVAQAKELPRVLEY